MRTYAPHIAILVCVAVTAGWTGYVAGSHPEAPIAPPDRPSGAVEIWHSSTDVERNKDLPITKPPKCLEYRTVYSVALPPLKAGDLIEADTSFEITNPYDYLAMFGRFIVLGDSAEDVTDIRIGPAAARNVIPGVHHDHFEQSASYVVKDDAGGKFVNVVTYAASMLAPDDKQIAPIEQGYGLLSVNVTRGAQISGAIVSTPRPAATDPKCIP